MRVAVDYHSTVGRKTGIGVAALNLVSALKEAAPQIEFIRYTAGKKDLNTMERIFWESARIPARLRKDKPDVMYSPGFAPPYWSPVRRVVTVHDLIGMIYPGNQGVVSRFYWQRWLPAALKRAEYLVASSENTKRDLIRLLGVKPERVRVVPLFVSEEFRPEAQSADADAAVMKKYGLHRPYLICAGTLEPRKNHLRLLRACEILWKEKKIDHALVISGKPGGAEKELYDFVKEKKIEEHVKFLGYTQDADMVSLIRSSEGFIQLSLYEGFGLPVLEAMSCGKSGVVSNRSSLPEITADAALSVDPENLPEISGAIRRYLTDEPLRRSLCEAALRRSALFSASATADAMVEVFKEASSGRNTT